MDSEPAPSRPPAGYGTPVGDVRPPSFQPPSRPPDPELVKDMQATLGARRELGPEYERELVEGFVSQLQQTVDGRVASALAEREREAHAPAIDGSRLALAIVSIGCGIPITAIAAGIGGVTGLVIVWVAIVVINVAAGLPSRRR